MDRNTAEQPSKRLSIGEFAKLTGVSQRTLRFYEEKGMLRPSHVSESGRRYYEMKDLIPLQQIITYKYLGFSLDEISTILENRSADIRSTLMLQRQAMEQKRERITQIIKAIDHAVELLNTDTEIDPQVFYFLIESIMTEKQQLEYLKDVFPEQTVNQIRSLFADEKRELEWSTRSAFLFQRMKQAVAHYPPEAPEMQALVGELMQMTEEIFGNNWDSLHEAAERLEEAEMPEFLTSPFTEEEEEIVMQACEIYMRAKGLMSDG